MPNADKTPVARKKSLKKVPSKKSLLKAKVADKIRAAATAFTAVGRVLQAEPKFFQEQTPAEEEDATTALKNKVYQVIKNAFSLAYTDDEELRINVDNIYPLLKALGLNPQSESVVDLVRDACMESTGDIDPKDFESVVLALIKEQDDDLWLGRLEEKQFLFWEAEAKKAKLEAERLRLEQEKKQASRKRKKMSTSGKNMNDRRRKKRRRKCRSLRKTSCTTI